MKSIKCKQCSGHYVLRTGNFGCFFGCSNYPVCRSTIQTSEYILMHVKANGIPIYRWYKPCWKCGKSTPVCSYYLSYELSKVSKALFLNYEIVGIGDLPSVDMTLSQSFKHIKMTNSQSTGRRGIANTCIHCNALQGHNYVVTDPHEIFDELFHNENIEKYNVGTINHVDIEQIRPYIEKFYGK